jgi:hypothetical protein
MRSLSKISLMPVLQPGRVSKVGKTAALLQRLAALLVFCSLSALLNCGGGGGAAVTATAVEANPAHPP